MTVPIVPVERPLDLIGVQNGRLDPALLVPVGPSGKLHHLAARAWLAMCAAARDAGFALTYTYGGTYRSYDQQEALFRSRYAIGGTYGGCKIWNGQTWCKKGNYATAAVPGTSNHGLGIAVDAALDSDLSDGVGPDDAVSIGPALDWLLANAARYGFSWELVDEPWHLRYVTGDHVPQAVLDFETGTTPPAPAPTPQPEPTPIPVPIPPTEEMPMRPFLFRISGYLNVFAMTDGGPIHASAVLLDRWTKEGFDRILVDDHPQFRKSVLTRCGLDHADLVPGGSTSVF